GLDEAGVGCACQSGGAKLVGPAPTGCSAGARRPGDAAERAGADRCRRPAARARRRPEARVIQVHQVLATLGYGDAIGHEVLGIQRMLRDAGYASEIFVETADYRLEALTRDYRELIDFSDP